jgi:lysophospholipase
VLPAVNERAALVILPGRTEPYIKYAELTYDLRAMGFTVYLLDHRGQGFSGRMTKDAEAGYVEHFDNYVQDFERFMKQVVLAKSHSRLFLLAHSMGGAVGAMYLERNPGVFNAVVLSAPMLQINTEPYPEFVALALVSANSRLLGNGKDYAPGRSGYNPNDLNDVTKSDIRYAQTHRLFSLYPETRIGGPTNRWVYESIRGTHKAVKNAADVVDPVLLFQAGDDLIVKPKGQNRFCAAAKDCTKLVFSGAYHEILMERDEVRDRALRELGAFFERHMFDTR